MRMWRALVGLVAFFGAGWILLRLGRVDWLRIDWSDPMGWLAAAGTENALAALARVAGLTLLAWICFSTLLYVGARRLGASAASVDWLSIGPVRRAIDGLLAGYLVMGSMTPAGAAIDPLPTHTPVAATTDQTLTAVDPAYIPVPAGSGQLDEEQEIEVEGDEASSPVPSGPTTVVVAPGDHLWKLAEDRMAAVWGRSPSDAEVAPYWVEVVEANRGRIRSGDPDLIFPGEEISLPDLSPES